MRNVMTRRTLSTIAITATASLGLAVALGQPALAGAPLSVAAARVTIEGSSNLHPYTASTTAVRVTKLVATPADGDVLQSAARPGGVEAFEITIASASLKSPKDGIDKNMHKALKAEAHPDIVFQLHALEGVGDTLRVAGTLTIAGVRREITLPVQAQRGGDRLTVSGATDILMTDYGITPPKAMLGMLKTDPKVVVRFEVVLTANEG
jgi:polyisoprenoid-binding protein YceI